MHFTHSHFTAFDSVMVRRRHQTQHTMYEIWMLVLCKHLKIWNANTKCQHILTIIKNNKNFFKKQSMFFSQCVLLTDSEGDAGHRKLPDVRKDDMSARRVSYKEPRAALPFNQYLPNKSNQTNYLPAPLRKRRSDREEDRMSLSNSTSPVGGERPLR